MNQISTIPTLMFGDEDACGIRGPGRSWTCEYNVMLAQLSFTQYTAANLSTHSGNHPLLAARGAQAVHLQPPDLTVSVALQSHKLLATSEYLPGTLVFIPEDQRIRSRLMSHIGNESNQ